MWHYRTLFIFILLSLLPPTAYSDRLPDPYYQQLFYSDLGIRYWESDFSPLEVELNMKIIEMETSWNSPQEGTWDLVAETRMEPKQRVVYRFVIDEPKILFEEYFENGRKKKTIRALDILEDKVRGVKRLITINMDEAKRRIAPLNETDIEKQYINFYIKKVVAEEEKKRIQAQKELEEVLKKEAAEKKERTAFLKTLPDFQSKAYIGFQNLKLIKVPWQISIESFDPTSGDFNGYARQLLANFQNPYQGSIRDKSFILFFHQNSQLVLNYDPKANEFDGNFHVNHRKIPFHFRAVSSFKKEETAIRSLLEKHKTFLVKLENSMEDQFPAEILFQSETNQITGRFDVSLELSSQMAVKGFLLGSKLYLSEEKWLTPEKWIFEKGPHFFVFDFDEEHNGLTGITQSDYDLDTNKHIKIHLIPDQ